MKRLTLRKPPPTLVYDIAYPLTLGEVITEGPNVSEVRWEHPTPWGKTSFTQNKHLCPVKPEVKHAKVPR